MSVFKDIRLITRLKLPLILHTWTGEVVIFAVSHHVAVTLLVFSQLFLRWVSSVFLIPSQCSLSPPPLPLWKKVGEMMAGLEGGGMEVPPSSLFSSPRFFTKPPVYLSESYLPNDGFLCFKWTVDIDVEFLESSLFTRAHAGTPLSLQIFTLCLSSFFLLTQQPSANFCFQDNHSISLLWFCHQGYCWWCEEVLKVFLFVSFVWDIGDEEAVMIENWFLMRCLQPVHPGMHWRIETGTQNNLNFWFILTLFNFALTPLNFLILFLFSNSFAFAWHRLPPRQACIDLNPLCVPSLLGAAAAACCADASVIH